jgi:outer membrane protein assembly factor BamB
MSGFEVGRNFWDFKASGIIWKVLPCSGRLIVGEERDPVKKTVSLFCVALDDGSVRWKGRKLGEDWWTGIETIHRGVIIVHEYPVPSMPEHRNIIAIDASSGERIWENRDLAFAFASGGTVCGSRELFDRRVFFEVDIVTGEVGRELTAHEAGQRRDSADEGWGMDVGIPAPSGDLPGPVRAAFPPGADLIAGETLMCNDIEISNCYESRTDGGARRTLREHIFALDSRTGAVLHRDVVCDGLSVPAGTTFFRAEARVLYVKDRGTLRSFALPEGSAA